MNRRLIYCFILVLLVHAPQQLCAQPVYEYFRNYEVQSGYVEYHNYYNEPGSTIKFWWDDYGQKYREEFITNGRINAINLADGSYFYTINMLTRLGNKVEACVAAQVQEYYANLHFTNVRSSETVLGYTCQTTETAGIITSSYKGIPLHVGEASGGDFLIAFMFEKNAVVGPEIFLLPNNIIIEDATETLRSEMMPQNEEENYYEPLPVSISYAQFIESCTIICRELNYEPISEYALNDLYSSCCGIYSDNEDNGICFQITVLSHYTSIPDWTFGEGRELLYHNGQRFIYYNYLNYDEEMGTQSQASNLTIEMPRENIILQIDTFPEKTKEEMLHIIDALGF